MDNERSSGLNVSLEEHIVNVLRPLPSIVPTELAKSLNSHLSPVSNTIPYPVLQAVSQWSRTSHGLEKMRINNPPLNPGAYTIVSLLAGTMTSPERNFGTYTPAKEPEEVEAERRKERKTISALLNALLSIGGSGVATWWAADKTGWKNEWRVLLSLFVTIVVAVSEAVLYIIWQARRSGSIQSKPHRKLASAEHKRNDGDIDLRDLNDNAAATSRASATDIRLRRRQ